MREWVRGTVCKNLSPLPLRTWVTLLPADSRCDLYLIWNQSILLAQEQRKLTCFGEEGRGSLLSLPLRDSQVRPKFSVSVSQTCAQQVPHAWEALRLGEGEAGVSQKLIVLFG